MNVTDTRAIEYPKENIFNRPSRLPPLWVLLYMGSILAAGVAGSSTDTIAGANVEHVFLGASLGLALMFLLFEGNFRRIEGLHRVLKYLTLFMLAIFLGFLSSIRPSLKIVGASTLIYWCGLVISIGVGALVALCGHTRWVLVVVALAGIPLFASVLQPLFPFLSQWIPAGRLHQLYGGRATGFFQNPNWTGLGLYCSLAACLSTFHFFRHRIVRGTCLLLFMFYVGATVLTLSRATILIMLLTGLVFLYTLWRRASHRRAILIVAFLLAAFALYGPASNVNWQDMHALRLFDTKAYEGDAFRFRAMQGVARNAGELFWLGEGSGQFKAKSHIYLANLSLPYITIYDKSAHNQIVAIWVEWGFLALLFMYSAHLWVVSRGVRNAGFDAGDALPMLLVTYLSILLYLQLHGANSPASCALMGLCVGYVFGGRSGAAAAREVSS